MKPKVKIMNHLGVRRVARILFDREDEKKIIRMLKKGGFDVDVGKCNW